MGRLLPWRLVAVPLLAAAAAVAIWGVALAVPAWQSPRRIARVLLPVAKIERASSVQVVIRQPDPPDRSVAVADFVTVLADVTAAGDSPVAVSIQWHDADRRRGIESMDPAVGEQPPPGTAIPFTGTIPAGSAPLRYRLLAGDAETLWHTLTPVPRPQLRGIEAIIEGPSYAAVEPRRRRFEPLPPGVPVTGQPDRWTIEAIAGSRVTVIATFDQPVLRARGTLVEGLATGPSDLLDGETIGSDQIQWRVPIERDGQFRIAATSAVTGLDNPFLTPIWLRAIQDGPPTIRWRKPAGSLAIVSPDAALDWTGEVYDELPVDLVAQQVLGPVAAVLERPLRRVADDPPSTRPVDNQPVASVVPVGWDMADPLAGTAGWTAATPFDPGTRVRTRLVAVDRAGQRGYSSWVDVLIAGQSVDPDRYERPKRLADAVLPAAAWMDEVIVQCDLRRTRYGKPAEGDTNGLPPGWIEADEMARRWETIRGPLRQSNDAAGLTGWLGDYDPQLVDQTALLIRLGSAAATGLQRLDAAAKAWTGDGPLAGVADRADAPRMLVGRAVDARRDAEAGQKLAPTILHLAIGRVLQRDLAAAAASLQPLVGDQAVFVHDDGTGLIDLAIAQMAQTESMADPLSSQFGEPAARLHRQLWSSLADASRRAGEVAHQWRTEGGGEKNEGIEKLRGVIETLRHAIVHQTIESRSNSHLVAAQKADPMAAAAVTAAIAAPGSVIDRRVRVIQSKAVTGNSFDDAIGALYDQSIAGLERRFDDARLVEQRRVAPEVVAVSDRQLLQMVAAHLRKETSVERFDPRWTTFSRAASGLLAATEVLRTTESLADLAAAERYDHDPISMRVDRPVQIDRIATSLSAAVPVLQDNDLGWEMIRSIADARYGPAMNRATDWISRRRWSGDPPVPAAAALDQVVAVYREASSVVTDRAVRARRALRDLLPSVQQLAQAAAADVREQKQSADDSSLPPSVEQLADRLLNEADSASDASETIDPETIDPETIDPETIDPETIDPEAIDAAAALSALTPAIDAAQSSPPADRDDAAEQLAQTLDRIAQLDAQPPDSDAAREIRDSLTAASPPPPPANTPDAESLTRRMDQDAAMRAEMQKLAADAVAAAAAALAETADQEQSLRESIEQADVAEQTRQQDWQQSMRHLAREIRAVDQGLVRAAKEAAQVNVRESGSGAAAPIAEAIEQARQQLDQARQQAESVRHDQTLRQQFEDAAGSVASAIKQAGQTLRDAADQADVMTNRELPNDDRQKNVLKEMQRLQRNKENEWLRQLGRQVTDAESDKRNADRAATEAGRQASQRQDQLAKAKKSAAAKADDADRQRRVAEAKEQSQIADAKAQATAAVAESVDQRLEQTRQRLKEQKAIGLVDLDVKNPAAAMISQQADRAAGHLDQVRRSLGEVAKEIEASPAPVAPASKAVRLAETQQRLADAVRRTADELATAAKTTAQLNQPEQAASIERQAGEVRQIADQPMGQAAKSLGQSSESTQADAQLKRSAEQLRQAADEAARSAGELNPSANDRPGEGSTTADREASAANPSSMSAQNAAQMLDQMRRAEASGQPAGSPTSSIARGRQATQQQAAAMRRRAELAAAMAGQLAGQLAAGDPTGPPSTTPSTAMSEPSGPPTEAAGGGVGAGEGSGEIPAPGGAPGRAEVDPDWAKLRDRSTDPTRGVDSINLPPGYREAAAAYFEAIAAESGR